ncbi:hypothetical protein DICPUDRAFT_150085 [Dictyostelium purpureum]|uniref:Uncharacterized protein n=1 Tax=Dictyostelium purpureum TaxID=5786 RepID=F0ZFE9_DICPU|nr:uncharacterized protein DICPUDRAFT_150085 [Dictyostelium purpureum]EGC37342.1 hypothetical protein DICPUDRAFT_150085 [Dictyostelium purpureum]|eukprot:XP_003286156.1 hypothetical protein DICPUDRAFT_150085 [Dictyostelium purpureum]
MQEPNGQSTAPGYNHPVNPAQQEYAAQPPQAYPQYSGPPTQPNQAYYPSPTQQQPVYGAPPTQPQPVYVTAPPPVTVAKANDPSVDQGAVNSALLIFVCGFFCTVLWLAGFAYIRHKNKTARVYGILSN